jgi:hypothetical protein
MITATPESSCIRCIGQTTALTKVITIKSIQHLHESLEASYKCAAESWSVIERTLSLDKNQLVAHEALFVVTPNNWGGLHGLHTGDAICSRLIYELLKVRSASTIVVTGIRYSKWLSHAYAVQAILR